ncbi:hypothetical protein KKF70_06540 [bacterium]|nr:hypothetical protein [bacterium]MBU3930217.1 hypothetical protein [bacterium]
MEVEGNSVSVLFSYSARVFFFGACFIISLGSLSASTFVLTFDQGDKESYYDAGCSSLTWNHDEGYLCLSGGVEQTILMSSYPTMPVVSPPQPTAQLGYEFTVLENCYISGFARFAGAEGGNPIVRLWTDDTGEFLGGIQYPWIDIAVGNNAGWSERSIDFYSLLYPLTKGNIYWIANVADGQVGHLVGNLGASAVSGSDYLNITTPWGFWYLDNDERSPGNVTDPTANLMYIPFLEGVADLKLNRFNAAGSIVTKAIDLGATKIDISAFQVIFQTANAGTGFDEIQQTGFLSYDIIYDAIASVGLTPQCSSAFGLAESDDNIAYSEYSTSTFSNISKRYIKLSCEMNTQHRGITPILDQVVIDYNAYPEAIDSSSVLPSDGSSISAENPCFSWNPAFDYDGDAVTYTLSLSASQEFGDLVFSTTVVSIPSSAEVVVNYIDRLNPVTSYYFKIDMQDANSAVVAADRVYSFRTPDVTPNSPATPVIFSPKDEFVADPNPLFSWSDFYDADGDFQSSFWLRVRSATGTYSSGNSMDSGEVLSSENEWTPTGWDLPFGNTYYWRVRVRDDTGFDDSWSEWSAEQLFIRIPQAPSGVSINLPQGETQIKNNDTISITGTAEEGTFCVILIRDQNGRALYDGITFSGLSVGADGLIDAQVSLGNIAVNYRLASQIRVEVVLIDPAGHRSAAASSAFVVFKAGKEQATIYDNLMTPPGVKPVTIRYELPAASNVTITVYAGNGTLVKKITDNQFMPSGVHTAEWFGKNASGNPVASGVYSIHIKTDSYSKLLKAIVVK